MAEILNVGIDLGTSRSAISASNGERFVVESFVGWPVDMVARKVLKRDVLIGHEAVANRTMLDLHRPLERGLLKEGSEKDIEAVRELLKHLLRLVGVNGSSGKIDAANVRAVVGVPAASLRTNKQYLRNAMKGIVDSLLSVTEPFALRTTAWLNDAGVPVLVMHGTRDGVIPYALGKKLYDDLRVEKQMLTSHAGHCEIPLFEPARYYDAVTRFIRKETS